MLAVTAPPHGGPETMRLTRRERPTPGPRQVLVRVQAIGVNRADAMQRAGTYAPPPGESDVLGLELTGEVIALGPEARRFREGERIFGLVAAGAYAEYAVVDERIAVRVPEGWDAVRAAAVIETFCTANETLFTLGRLAAGERVLIHAAGSGVGSSGIQMARHVGAEVVTTAGSDEKLRRALALGATHAINYKSQDFAQVIAALDPPGVDLVEDFVGASYLQRHLAVLRPLGRMVSVGLLGPTEATIDPRPILYKRLTLMGFTLRPQTIDEKEAIVGRFVERWMKPLQEGQVEAVIHAVLPFTQVAEAHRMMEAGENFGKIVLTAP